MRESDVSTLHRFDVLLARKLLVQNNACEGLMFIMLHRFDFSPTRKPLDENEACKEVIFRALHRFDVSLTRKPLAQNVSIPLFGIGMGLDPCPHGAFVKEVSAQVSSLPGTSCILCLP